MVSNIFFIKGFFYIYPLLPLASRQQPVKNGNFIRHLFSSEIRHCWRPGEEAHCFKAHAQHQLRLKLQTYFFAGFVNIKFLTVEQHFRFIIGKTKGSIIYRRYYFFSLFINTSPF